MYGIPQVYFVSEYPLQRFGIYGRRDKKHSVFMEAAIWNQNMQVG
ncbi:hypothetical protein LCGC14_2236970 [marine sediment metagenome]|uniref:Uncharacterized protein n=1 Tax=marine sediment metagenome TaxID=412755 RepID=A0A0F9G1N7_9ZZZZ